MINAIVAALYITTIPGCPKLIVTAERGLTREWHTTDDLVIEALHEHCQMHNLWYGKTLIQHRNFHYSYTCGPKTDCEEQ